MHKVQSKASIGKTSPLGEQILHKKISDKKQVYDAYDFGDKLGEGSFGVVYSVTHKETCTQWACKIINLERAEKACNPKLKLIKREVIILKKVKHEHIIQLKEVLETNEEIYLIMELCEGGELSKLVSRNGGPLPENDVRIIISRLASAISYLHRNDMVHRDLKLENVLIAKNPTDSSDKLYIKVTDFGLSVVKNGVTTDDMMDEFCGTPLYMAPEIRTNKTYSEKCDVWAMGIIMLILLTGRAPTCSNNGAADTDSYSNGHSVELSGKEWDSLSESARDCVVEMLREDTAYRCTANEILAHHFIKNKKEMFDNVKQEEATRSRNVMELMKDFNKLNEDDIDFTDDVTKLDPVTPVLDPLTSLCDPVTPICPRASSAPGGAHARGRGQVLPPPSPSNVTAPRRESNPTEPSLKEATKSSTTRPRPSPVKVESNNIKSSATNSRKAATRSSISTSSGVTLAASLKTKQDMKQPLRVAVTDVKDRRNRTTSLSQSTGNLTNCEGLVASSKTTRNSKV